MRRMRKVCLSYQNETITFEVTPEDISVKESQLYRRWELLDGEYAEIGGRGLKTVFFEALIPGDGRSYAGTETQAKKLALITAWKDACGAIDVAVSDEDNANVIVKGKFYITMLAKRVREGDSDVMIETELLEARLPADASAAAEEEGGSTEAAAQRYYTVVKGDCLWHIAQKQYGTGAKWRVIYDANKATIGCNPNLIYPGQRLVLP